MPRLLGAYETTLAPVVDEIVAASPSLVIDVGCAEGYYAIGLARRLHSSTIWARDANPAALEKCARLADLNGVQDRVTTGGVMTHADFDICLSQKTVVICDIEGGEADLLDPHKAKGLQAADILVECHPTPKRPVLQTLRDRFEATHTITQIDRGLDSAALPVWLDGANDLDRLLAL